MASIEKPALQALIVDWQRLEMITRNLYPGLSDEEVATYVKLAILRLYPALNA